MSTSSVVSWWPSLISGLYYLTLTEDIEFVEYSRSKTFEAGSDGFITCNVTGVPRPTVSWRKDGRRIRMGTSTA